MKTKQIKWQILELFLLGPGTRMAVWKRNPTVCAWEKFKRITGMLRADGFIESTPGTIPMQSVCQLTTKGNNSIKKWKEANK